MSASGDTDWEIRGAVLPGREGRWRVSVAGSRIASVVPCEHDLPEAPFSWSADGRLVSMAFVDPHVHLDKALTCERTGASAAANLAQAVQAVRRLKGEFTTADIAERAQRCLQMGLAHGTTAVRSNCEADRFVGQRAVAGLRAAEQAMGGRVEVQLIAFPQEGWFETPGTLEDGAGPHVARAVEEGVSIVGGNINARLWPSDPERQVDETFALATGQDCDIDYHLDNWDGPEAFTLPYVARKTLETGWHGRVAVSHIASLAHVSDAAAAEAIDLARAADLQVCVLPTRIRLTRVRELMEAGVNVACGTDNLRDPFVRFGDADPLKAMLLLAQLTGLLDDRGLEKVWQTMTTNAARMLRLPDRGLAAGCLADLVVVDATSVPQAILHQSRRLAVIRGGRQVAGPLAVVPPNPPGVPSCLA